jgi:MoaA/NifB/PqqE/SkfB family radical SAM enzyme
VSEAAAPDAPALDAVVAREGAAQEVRQWVRLTRRCNNRCLFCHDALRHDGTAVPVEHAREEIAAGRSRGAERLVLSGGEPTIHPAFVDLVAAGRAAGYRWVQAITNGRMFAYDRFAERAVAAGLDEVTVSLHGHTPELHDGLVGVQGAFAQTLRGIRTLQRLGRVVSVDVVVCRPNVRHLAEMLRAFLALGLREFDLLHLVPFGRAFEEHREDLYFDPGAERGHVLEALELRRRPDVHVWTNRWPAALLEGAEELIQDPLKVLDEVRGTAEGFEAWLGAGEEPECRGERCRRCFLEGFCRDLAAARRRLLDGSFEVVAVDVGAAPLQPGAAAALARQETAALRVRASGPEDLARALRALPRGGDAELELDLDALGALPAAIAARTRRAVVRRVEDLAAALALPRAELEIPLERSALEAARRAVAAAPERVVLRSRGRTRLAEVRSEDLAPAEIAGAAAGVRAEGVPPCLAPRARPPAATLDAATLSPDGALELLPLARAWVRDGYRTRSLRCEDCAAGAGCPGAHVNYVRAHGFGWMAPLPGE